MGVYRGINFSPFNNYDISATSSSSTNQVVTQPTNGTLATDLMVSNSTTFTAYVAWGLTSATATSTSLAVLPGAIMIVNMGMPATNVAVLLSGSGSSGTINISIGNGT